MKKSNTSKKHPVPFYIAMVALCLLLVSTYMTSGLFARYATGISASDAARVAMFRTPTITFTSPNASPDIELDTYDTSLNSVTTTFTVSMMTEVAAKYDVIVTCPDPLPADGYVKMTLDGKAPVASGSVYTFTDVGTFAAGGQRTNSHDLTFTADLGWHDEGMDLDNINVKVIVTQID